MRFLVLFCLLCAFGGVLRAQLPDLTRRGDTLFAPEAKTYQWLHDGAEVPGATQRFYVPPGKDGVFTVRLRSLTSAPTDYTTSPTVVVTGAVLDEFLRPINGAEVTVAGVKGKSGADGRFYIAAQRAARLAARAVMSGYHAHTVGFMPTAADTQFVYLHLAKQVTTHKLPANTGGTISQGGFWLTLPPNSVVDADGKAYSGEIQLSVVARRPGDRDFAQRMPGGDFMAVDAAGESKVLYSYGFTGVEMTDADGKPLNLAPDSVATIEFLITEDQRPGAPDTLPLWHFEEEKGLWVEAGTVRKEGLTYRAQVGHFSWWNYDMPYPPAHVEGKVVDCKGNPVLGSPVLVGQRAAVTDNEGNFIGTVPATIDLDFHVVNTDTTLAPLAAEETRPLGSFDAGWGEFQAFGLADTYNILTVYAYGATEGVEYSLDGEHWQSEPVFVLQNDSVPQHGWARAQGCDPMSFNNYTPSRFMDCLLLDSAALHAAPIIHSSELLLSANQVIHHVDIMGDNMQAIASAARQQNCVQWAKFSIFLDTPLESSVGLNQLAGLWPSLQYLGVDNIKLESVPESVGSLTKLKVLSLKFNSITSLPESLGNLVQLLSLTLDDNYIGSAPNWLVNMTNLNRLSMSGVGLKTLPDSLGNLTDLHILNLHGNHLTSLPASIINLYKLKYLYLGNNQLASLPDSLGNLTALTDLDLSGNKLTSLPDSLGNMTSLQTLDLSTNQLTAVPESLGNLTNLQELYLGGSNQLTRVPECLGNLTALTDLTLSGNKLTSLPDALGKLANLQNLNLYNNQLTTLPECLGNLTALTDLALGGNKLTSLPDALGNLDSLQTLNLSTNQLTSLPESLGNLADTLKTLYLSANPISPAEKARIKAMLPNTNIYF